MTGYIFENGGLNVSKRLPGTLGIWKKHIHVNICAIYIDLCAISNFICDDALNDWHETRAKRALLDDPCFQSSMVFDLSIFNFVLNILINSAIACIEMNISKSKIQMKHNADETNMILGLVSLHPNIQNQIKSNKNSERMQKIK